MEYGQKVYTVNAKTNEIDEWFYEGILPAENELLACLRNGKKYTHLPLRCVYLSEETAKEVAKL